MPEGPEEMPETPEIPEMPEGLEGPPPGMEIKEEGEEMISEPMEDENPAFLDVLKKKGKKEDEDEEAM
jgi:hypothetical protein